MKKPDKKKLEAKLREIEKKEEKLAEKKEKEKLIKQQTVYNKKYAGRFFEIKNLWKITDHEIEFRRDRDDKSVIHLYVELLPNLPSAWNANVKLYYFSSRTFCIRNCKLYDWPSVRKEIDARVKMPYPTGEELDEMLRINNKEKPRTDHDFVNWLMQKQNIDTYKEAFVRAEVDKDVITGRLKKVIAGFPA